MNSFERQWIVSQNKEQLEQILSSAEHGKMQIELAYIHFACYLIPASGSSGNALTLEQEVCGPNLRQV